MKTLGKIFSVLMIFFAGGLITCGGNFLLLSTGIHLPGGNGGIGFVITLWIFELIFIFLYAIWKVYFRDSIHKEEYPLQNIAPSKEITGFIPTATSELMSTLSKIDISSISSISFLPTNGQGFTIKTPNIKRLSAYITTKLGKTSFEREELREIFDYVVLYLKSELSNTDFNLIEGKINGFVTTGGEVKIEKV